MHETDVVLVYLLRNRIRCSFLAHYYRCAEKAASQSHAGYRISKEAPSCNTHRDSPTPEPFASQLAEPADSQQQQTKVKRSGVQALVSPSFVSIVQATSFRLDFRTRGFCSGSHHPSQDPCGYSTPIRPRGLFERIISRNEPESRRMWWCHLGKALSGSVTGCVG